MSVNPPSSSTRPMLCPLYHGPNERLPTFADMSCLHIDQIQLRNDYVMRKGVLRRVALLVRRTSDNK